MLSADLYDAETAERYGWVNWAVPADEVDDFVDRLARNIAALPEGVIAAVKRAIAPENLADGLVREHDAWAGHFVRPAAERLIRGGLADGAQTHDGERDLEGLLRGVTGQDRDRSPRTQRCPVDRDSASPARPPGRMPTSVVDRRVAS